MVQEDEAEDEGEDEVSYAVEGLSPIELYSLQTILNHAIIEADGQHSIMAESLSKKVNKVIASDEFRECMDEEIEEVRESYQMDEIKVDPNPGAGGTFQ